MLAAIHWGLKQKLDPGAAIEGNGYAKAQEMGLTLPTNWQAAIDLFAQSDRHEGLFRHPLPPRLRVGETGGI